MSSSGSGTGTPISTSPSGSVIATSILPGVSLGLSLDRYQEIMRLPAAAFNGLYKDEDAACYDCAAIWKRSDRDALALAIAQAEEMRERELGYFLYPKYTDDEYHDYNPRGIIILDRKHLIAVGSKVCTVLQSDFPFALSSGGVVIDPVVLTFESSVSLDEIHVYYVGTDIEIFPSRKYVDGVNVVLEIPRSRLVDPGVDTNCDPAPRYDNDDNFVSSVDIKRCYTDPSDGAFVVWDTACCSPCDSAISSSSQLLHSTIISNRLSAINVRPASYSNGIWTFNCNISNNCIPDRYKVSYLSGIRYSVYTEMQTIRLAHTLIPSILPELVDLCSRCWKQDIAKDENAAITPYGDTRGAIFAWLADSRAKVGFGAKTPRSR